MLARTFRRTLTSVAQTRAASTLVVAEHADGALQPGTLSAITAATAVGGPVSVLVAGSGAAVADVAKAAAAVPGVETVLTADDASLEHGVAEDLAAAVHATAADKGFTHVFAPSTNFSKNYLPRVAALLGVAPLTDIMSVESEDTFTRPMYAGNAIAKVQSSDSVKVATVRTTNFDKAATEGGSAAVEAAPSFTAAHLTKFMGEEKTVSDRPELTVADVVIAGGRGMKDGKHFDMLYTLADKLGGAVGASRAAVDAGMVPNDMQIGQTGKVVAPNLYVAVGISGAIQHLAGMKDSKTIVCVNKDPEAPIFQVSDYGLVADLFDAVPEFESKV